ncbi:MAG: putative Ig domain-containing protein [Vicinamibacterales bacterium]
MSLAPRARSLLTAFVAAATLAVGTAILGAGNLASVSPTGASSGVPLAINGTGFNTTASQNEVTFTHVSGVTATAVPSRVVTGTGVLRLTVTVPSGLPVGRADLRVLNRATGEVSQGLWIEVLDFSLTGITAAPRGGSSVAVAIQGSPNSKFVAGSTRAVFGAGVTVHSTTVTSATTLVASISVAETATLGPRSVAVTSPNQQAIAENVFTITPAGTPTNNNPTITSVPNTSATEGQPYSYDVNASDPDAGDSLTYSITTAPGGMTIHPSTGLIAWTPVAAHLPSAQVVVQVSDGKGGSATQSFTINVAPAPNQNPSVTSTPPTSATEGQPYTYDVGASDPDSADVLTFNLTTAPGGMTIDPATGLIQWTPAASHVPSVQVVVQVLDGKGGSTTQSFTIDVTAAPPPNQQPFITSTPVNSATEGQSYTYDVDASDPDAGDTLSYTLTQAPAGMTVDSATGVIAWLPSLLSSSVPVTVVVSDGRTGTATQSFTIAVAPAALGRGVIAGWVFDDATGSPIQNASVQLLDASGGAAAVLPVNSDSFGRFRLSVAAGPARLRVSKDGFTAADLTVIVIDGRRVEPDDARLTALNTATPIVSSVAGGSVAHGAARVVFAPGGLTEDRLVRLTEIGLQGAIRRLPLGWNPLAIVEVAAGNPFVANARLAARMTPLPPVSRDVILAKWDYDSGSWLALGAATRSTDGTSLEGEIPESGQYAFTMADLAPNAPAIPASGSALTGLSPRPPPALTLTLNPAPRILFAQSGARSVVAATANPAEPLPSGTPLEIDLTESFTFASGSALRPMPGRRRLGLYGVTDGPSNALRASFGVAPSRPLTPFSVRDGAIDLAGKLPAEPFAPRGRVLGGQGGEFTAPTGERVIVPPGSSAEDLPLDVRPIAPADFPLTIPGGLTLLRSFVLDLHGAPLTRDLQIVLPSTDPVPSGTAAMVVELVDVGEATRLVLVAMAISQTGGLISTVDPLGDGSVHLPGIRSEGRYAVLQATGNFGYVTGEVTATGGAPLGGALVEGVNVPVAAMSDATGRYTLLLPAGPIDVRVTNPANGDGTLINTQVAGNFAVTNRPASLGASPPVIVAVTPGNGATKVPLGSSVAVTFSEPIDPASVTSGALTVASSAGPVAGTLALAPGNIALTFRPAALLVSQTLYTLSVAATIRDTAGHALAAPFVSQFTSVDVTPPAPPPAGTVVASIPDTTGTTTITGSQGTADPGGVVVVRNLRNNALTTLTPNTDGSFSGVVSALRSDRLEMTIRDAAGNETTVPVAAFRDANGAVVVGAAGGRVEGPGGVFVEIPVGAVPDGTVVRVSPLIASDFAIAPLAEFPFVAGVNLDLGGVVPREPLDIGVLAPPDATPDDQVIVGRLGSLAGRAVWSVFDRAPLVDGRYQTASPPFMGVIAQGSYGFLRIVNNCMSWVTVDYQFQAAYAVTIVGIPFVNFTTDATTATLPAVCNSTLDLVVVTLDTEDVIQSVTFRAPAVRDEIGQIPNVLSDDEIPPVTVGSNLPTGGQVDQFELKFSEAMNADSVRNGLLVTDASGAPVDGVVEFFDGARRMVFRPAVPFRPGERYTASLLGATDLAGNVYVGDPVAFTPFEPESLVRLGDVPEISDLLKVCSNPSSCSAAGIDVAFAGDTLFIANGLRSADSDYEFAPPSRLVVVDVGDPRNPRLIGFHSTATNPRALAVVRKATFPAGEGVFAGDLLLVAGGGRVPGGELASKLEIYDVSACTARPLPEPIVNCLGTTVQPRGSRLLSTPIGAVPAQGVPPASGVPLQIAALHSKRTLPAGDTVIAYVLTTPLGLMAVDVVRAFGNSADADGDKGPHAFISGDFLDVGVVKDAVIALETPGPGGISALQVFTPELVARQEIVLADPATRLTLVSNLVVDVDRDGNLGLRENDDEDIGRVIEAKDELFDLAFVTSALPSEDCAGGVVCGALTVVDLSSLTDLFHAGPAHVIGRVPLPGEAFSLDVDAGRLMAYVEIRRHGLALIDLSFLNDALSEVPGATPRNFTDLIDLDGNGGDDRVLRIFPKRDIFLTRLKVDFTTGIAYTSGSTTGPELIQVCNVCNELALDFREHPSAAQTRSLRDERDALASIVVEARQRLGNLMPWLRAPGALYFLEQGSGACLWATPNPTDNDLAASCGRTGFELGTSDHDIEVMVPADDVEVAQILLDHYVEEILRGNPPAVADLNMYAIPSEAFEAAVLPVGMPISPAGADPTGDLGMARQQLLLLWLLTGEYIDVVPVGPIQLDALVTRLSTPTIPGQFTGIPNFEGYERALLEKFNLYKSGVMLRIKGACENDGRSVTISRGSATTIDITDPGRNFDGPNLASQNCQQEVHAVAKAAVRAAMGRLVATTTTNQLLLSATHGTRQSLRSPTGCLTGVENPVEPPLDLSSYFPKPCGSFEEFIASTAVRSADLGVFAPNEIRQIVRFACLKVGGAQCRDKNNEPVRAPGVPILETDADVNAFIVEALRFIERALELTSLQYPRGDNSGLSIAADSLLIGEIPGGLPDFLRVQNTCRNVGVTIEQATTPRAVVRHCNERIVLARIDAAQKEVRKPLAVRALNLGANTINGLTVTLYDGDGVNQQDYDVLHVHPLSLLSGEIRVLDVELDVEAARNRAIFDEPFNMEALSARAPFARVFMLDSPNRVPEANRLDNVAGFFYYKLDLDNPSVPATPESPVPPDDVSPDPNCIPQPRFELDMAFHTPGGPGSGAPEATVSVYQTVTIRYRVRNTGQLPLRDVDVVRAGRTVLHAATIAPGGSFTITERFTPTQAGLQNLFAAATAKDEGGNLIGPEIGSALLNVTADHQHFTIELFDASPLNDLQHPFSRWHVNRDEGRDVPVLGATTDGDESGGGRLRIFVQGLQPRTQALVSIVDGELTGVTDGIGRLVNGAGEPITTIDVGDGGEATLFYVPPSVFVRDAHNAADHGWPATFVKEERTVKFTIQQVGFGQSTRRISLRRPPVFLIHGLFSTTESWNYFQPLVPADAGAADQFKGFDGRFDVFKIGMPYASARFSEGTESIKAQIRGAIAEYLPQYAVGKIDIVGHSMGGVLARKLTNDDPAVQKAVRKIIAMNSPFGGSQLADKIVEQRDRLPIAASPTDVASVLKIIGDNPERVLSPEAKPQALADMCALTIQGMDLTLRFNLTGAVDDLQTTSAEIAALRAGGVRVPSHHIVGTTTEQTELGIDFSPVGGALFLSPTEAMWSALGLLCNWTPDASTAHTTTLLKVSKEALTAVIGIAKMSKLRGTARTKAWMSAWEDANKMAVKELLIGGDPTPVFPLENDRVVSEASQREGLPADTLAMTVVAGHTDHAVVRNTPELTVESCRTLDPLEGPRIQSDSRDRNHDLTPDVTCRVIQLLEADPAGNLFFRN